MKGRDFEAALAEVDLMLFVWDEALATRWSGEPVTRQPVHTMYLPADHVSADVIDACRQGARESLSLHGGDAGAMAEIVGLPERLVEQAWPRVLHKLEREPIEDLRIDLEDGYGLREDSQEDTHAEAAGHVLAALAGSSGAPFSLGVRVKSLEGSTRRRGLRSLDLVLAALLESRTTLPTGFVFTLPKVTSVEQVRAMVHMCHRLEQSHNLELGALRFEVQVETPQVVLGADGTATVARLVHEAQGRCVGLHYGTYDYSASLGIAPAYQSLDHPAADHAKAVMQVAAAGTGVRLSDGSSNVLPVGDRAAVHAAWALHARLVRHSLERGFYQGWDLHPAQLPTRYLATYAFFREGLSAAAARMRGYAMRAESGVLDEPATAFGLSSFLLRGVDCGAFDLTEVLNACELDELTLARYARRRQTGVERINQLPRELLHRVLLEVCASPRWADTVADARPFETPEMLYAAADEALKTLDESGVDAALAGHPRIGERPSGPRSEASHQEQREVARADQDVLDALADGNRAYEERFGHVYLVCATGRTAEELLDVLRARLANDPETERTVMRSELGKINRLRLERLVKGM
jgi:OHCU decarboxylase